MKEFDEESTIKFNELIESVEKKVLLYTSELKRKQDEQDVYISLATVFLRWVHDVDTGNPKNIVKHFCKVIMEAVEKTDQEKNARS